MLPRKTRKNFKSALAFGSLNKVKGYFLRHQGLTATFNKEGLTAMHLAVMENRLDVVQLAVGEFAWNVKGEDIWGNGLRAWAMVFRNREIDEFLQVQGAEMPTAVSLSRQSPYPSHICRAECPLYLHFACK